VTFRNLVGTMSGFMTDAEDWMPATAQDRPYYAVKSFATGAGPAPAIGEKYWVDMADYLRYGEQFRNFNPDDVWFNGQQGAFTVALPRASGDTRYLTDQEELAVFRDAGGHQHLFRLEGVISLDIMSPIGRDTTK
jgi:hypothetical protein